jgi:hypothetical protein
LTPPDRRCLIGGAFRNPIVLLGFASLLGNGFSMAVSNALGTRSDGEAADQAHREELRRIGAAKGFDGDTPERGAGLRAWIGNGPAA